MFGVLVYVDILMIVATMASAAVMNYYDDGTYIHTEAASRCYKVALYMSIFPLFYAMMRSAERVFDITLITDELERTSKKEVERLTLELAQVAADASSALKADKDQAQTTMESELAAAESALAAATDYHQNEPKGFVYPNREFYLGDHLRWIPPARHPARVRRSNL